MREGNIFNANGYMIKPNGVSSSHPKGEKTVDTPISVNEEVHPNVYPAIRGEFGAAFFR